MTRARQFAISGVAIALALISAGWLTGLRQVMHVALLSVATVAFFPFVVIAACLFLIAACALLVAFGGDGGGGGDPHAEGLAEGVAAAAMAIPRYYRWLASQRHPLL